MILYFLDQSIETVIIFFKHIFKAVLKNRIHFFCPKNVAPRVGKNYFSLRPGSSSIRSKLFMAEVK